MYLEGISSNRGPVLFGRFSYTGCANIYTELKRGLTEDSDILRVEQAATTPSLAGYSFFVHLAIK